ncbi:MAG TPA: TIGR03560 family F420-dependent LLM class oxidoreductase [Candidatus Limnocylindrales bacterium]|nr:TIGR03560 family F420-dependent LLM class oxidoreductase [Candidatus Limnocylindrales bacterium]
MVVRFGIQTAQQNMTWRELHDTWVAADSWGYDSLWLFDHFYPIFSDPDGPCHEGWTLLAALAHATRLARIGHLVTGNTYRNPCVLAKMAVSVDHISAGRLNLGLGAGWYELEHDSFGIEYPPIPRRLGALDESCRILKGMLRGERISLDGNHYRVRDAHAEPGPVQAGGPPLMIGGAGRKVLLRIVAEHADMWNSFGTPAQMKELIDVIRDHGDRLGRDTDAIEKSVALPLCYSTNSDRQTSACSTLARAYGLSPEQARERIMIGSKDECLEQVRSYLAVGVTHFIFLSFGPVLLDELQAFSEEVAPAARRL